MSSRKIVELAQLDSAALLEELVSRASPQIINELAEHIADLSPPLLTNLTRNLFSMIPLATRTADRKFARKDIPYILERCRKRNAKAPIYGGFLLPCLELIASGNDASEREEFRESLVNMLHGTPKQSGFAATAFSGIVSFREHLIALQKSR